MKYSGLFKASAILVIIISVVVILVYAKPFLIPVSFGALLAMVLLPVTKWLHRKGINQVLSVILSILLLIGIFSLLIYFISSQVSDIAGNTSKIEEQFSIKIQQAQKFLAEQLGIPAEKQQQMIQKQQESSSGRMTSMVTGLLSGVGGFLTNSILVLVYIFLFIYFRDRLKGFIVKLVQKDQVPNALNAIHNVQQVAQKYLGGLAMMIVILWIMYGIGFTIAGVKNAFFFAIICGILEIVPFVGNITGTILTLAMSVAQGGGMNLIIGILLTYALVQFIQTYFIEPLVVGSEVNINPLFTILALIGGEVLWGIPGMIMAIPFIGMLKIVCDHVEPLKPYAYLIGNDKKKVNRSFKKDAASFSNRVRGLFR